jgi:hypothetical protein
VWNLKPERWGSPLVQEKYQEESLWQAITTIIIIITKNTIVQVWKPIHLIKYLIMLFTKQL